ncbi:MAG: YdcF family protein [Polyangiaceae bacterium]
MYPTHVLAPWSLPVALALLVASLGCASEESLSPVDAGAPPDPVVESCPTESMVELYPDVLPPDLYGPKPAATSCVATEHDVIIVLGCPTEDDGAPSACQMARADIAIRLMDAGYGQRFITTGGAVQNAFVEAETLATLLVERGVPEADIFLEPQAEHTDENIYYATQIMLQEQYRSAVVVSDEPGHLLLTALCDTNCCVDLGRLTVFDFAIGEGEPVLAGHYALYPYAAEVSDAECAQIAPDSKFMCLNLPERKACAADFQL